MYKVYCKHYTLVLDDKCRVLCAFGSDDWIGHYCTAAPLKYYGAVDTWAPLGYMASKVKTSEQRMEEECKEYILTSKA